MARRTPQKRLPGRSSDTKNNGDQYRRRWKWDKVVWGSHVVDCYPTVGSCPYRVYVRDGAAVFEEQAGVFPVVEKGVPDFNPAGCQKGACWAQQLRADERVLYPLKRAGERGAGKWQRVSWDQALTEIADGIIDAVQEVGPEAVFSPGGANAMAWGMVAQRRFSSLTGFPLTDWDGDIGDCSPGMYLTWGKHVDASQDDFFHSELLLVWFCNPAYTRIPVYHYLSEARYNGTEVVIIAPDFSSSAPHADYHVPVKVGTDAALCLSMCKVVLDEGLVEDRFVREQTDLPLLVRLDNRKFLRASDLRDGGREDQFFFHDHRSQRVVEADRGTLDLGEVEPSLEGTYHVEMKDGASVEVTPVFQLLAQALQRYEPDEASRVCGVHADTIRMLARKVASKRTHAYEGLATGKYYHGDLMGRSMYLLLALTGNWGKKGTGPTFWNSGPSTGVHLLQARRTSGAQEAKDLLTALRQVLDALEAEDPTRTDEIALTELAHRMSALDGWHVPTAWWLYYHCGYRDVWNRRDWHDPSMRREFDEYFREALDKNWWAGVTAPPPDKPPRVMIEVGGNLLRRTRGGQNMFLRNLWPQLKTIVSVDVKMSSTGLWSDYVLPAAQQHERPHAHGYAGTMFYSLLEKAVEPAGEALPEWQIFRRLCSRLAERAKAREFTQYQDGRGRTFRLDNLDEAFTAGDTLVDEEQMVAEGVEASAIMRTVPEDTNIESLRETGVVHFTDWGLFPNAQSYATDVQTNESMAPFRNHLDKKVPYPTLTRRAQFYIDHDWFLEAGEELPCHKDPPRMGGDYPLVLTSGHNRWSVHSNNIVNRLLLQTHRGHPHVVIGQADAEARAIENDEEVLVHNDMGSCMVRAKVTPLAQPGQVIIYNGWEPYQFRDWQAPSNIEAGMVKWLHFAGGYGHLRYWPFMWQPIHVERATRVEVSKIS